MYPKQKSKKAFEKVSTEDWVTGIIEKVEYEENRNTGFKDDDTGEDIIKDCVKLTFKLNGYKFPHSTYWMTFSYHEKSGLFIKYLSNLVENAEPKMKFDLDNLQGMPVKMMWKDKGDYQEVETIRPLKAKVKREDGPVAAPAPKALSESEEQELDDSVIEETAALEDAPV